MSASVHRILVPVDYSDASLRAVQEAISLAETFGSEVHILHVSPRLASYLPLEEWIWGENKDAHAVDTKVREAASNAMQTFLEPLPSEHRARLRTRLETGIPSEVILRVSDGDGFDLVVMGRHGAGAARVFLGSTAIRVIRAASCRVLTVP